MGAWEPWEPGLQGRQLVDSLSLWGAMGTIGGLPFSAATSVLRGLAPLGGWPKAPRPMAPWVQKPRKH